MTTLRQFSMLDIFEYSNINLDILTETFSSNFYGEYICKWPEYCVSVIGAGNEIQAYLLGKVEGDESNKSKKRDWHGHVTAVTVSPNARKQGLARFLMNYLEAVSEHRHNAFFVDLFVRPSNEVAISMYRHFGYEVFRTIEKYYSGGSNRKSEDSYDMRKSLARDPKKELMQPTGKMIKPSELEFN